MICVDMAHFSAQGNLGQYEAQATLLHVMSQAAEDLGLDRDKWLTQTTGDGELAVLPADTPEPIVVGRLGQRLADILHTHNQSRVADYQIRLRVALHTGLVHLDSAAGFAGEAVVMVSRLCDSRPVRRALDAFPDAAVSMIVSDQLWDVVGQEYEGIRTKRFAKVRVSIPTKRFETSAWVHVPGEDVTTVPGLSDGDDSPPAQPQAIPPADPSYLQSNTGNGNVFVQGQDATGIHTQNNYGARHDDRG
jgi:hypothetical protein